jgi:hypothetical protein
MLAKLEESRESDKVTGWRGDKMTMLQQSKRAVMHEEPIEYDARIEVWRGILQQLLAIDIANMTPLQALNVLNEMQRVVKESSSQIVG